MEKISRRERIPTQMEKVSEDDDWKNDTTRL